MKILSTVALTGPNVWSGLPVLEARVDLSAWQSRSASVRRECAEQLQVWFPSLVLPAGVPAPAEGVAGQDPALEWAAQTLLDVALTLHALSRRPLTFGQVVDTAEAQACRLVMEYEEPPLAEACLAWAGELCEAAAGRRVPDVPAGLQRLRALADDSCLDVTTSAIVAVARQRRIPFRRLDPVALVQFGHGARQRRIISNIIDRTGIIAESISTDKDLTKALLREVGVPIPEGRPATDRDDAWRAACELGLPVVVKPRNADYQYGVGLNLRTRAAIEAAYDAARRHRDEVIVERFVPGAQFRVTVVGDRVVAAIRRVSPQVVGDGVQTITQLIAEANRLDPRRGADDAAQLDLIRPDDDTPQFLAEQGLTLDAIPPAGQVVVLSRLAHSVAGGEVRDVTDDMHPEVKAQCVRAAQVLGIDLAGLDLIVEDIGRPLEEQGGVVLEVNAGPCIALHFTPFCDRPRPICEAILDLLFPDGQAGRIPVAVVAEADERSPTGRLLEALLRRRGPRIGRSAAAGLYVQGRRIKAGACANVAGARSLLLCPDVELAILQQSCAQIRAEGLAIDRCDLAILADLGADAAPGSSRFAERVRAAGVLSESLGSAGVLVIDAEQLASFPPASALPQARLILTAAAEPATALTAAGTSAGRWVYRRGDDIVLRSAGRDEQVLSLPPGLLRGEAGSAALGRALLQAVAGAWGLAVPIDELQAGLTALPEALGP